MGPCTSPLGGVWSGLWGCRKCQHPKSSGSGIGLKDFCLHLSQKGIMESGQGNTEKSVEHGEEVNCKVV